MLDNFLFQIDKFLFGYGTDRTYILVFVFSILFLLLGYLSLKVKRILQATILFFVMSAVAFFPVFAFPEWIEKVGIKLGIITPWYVKQVPDLYRTPTLLIAITGSITLIYFIYNLLNDVIIASSSAKKFSMNWTKAEIDLERKEIEELKAASISNAKKPYRV